MEGLSYHVVVVVVVVAFFLYDPGTNIYIYIYICTTNITNVSLEEHTRQNTALLQEALHQIL